MRFDFDAADVGGMDREDLLDADAVRDVADRERLVGAGALAGNDDAAERLVAGLVAFLDLDMYSGCAACTQIRNVITHLALGNFLY